MAWAVSLTPMPSCWPTSWAPMPTLIGCCRQMASWSSGSQCSLVAARTPCGTGSRSPTSVDPVLENTFQRQSKPSKDSRSGLASAEARTILAAALTPALAAKLTTARLRRLLVAAGRQRNIDARVDQLHTAFAGEQMRQLPRVEAAFGEQARALVLQLDAACRAAEHLAAATEEIFTEPPDAAILTSFPRVGTLTVPGSWPRSVMISPDSAEARDLSLPTPARLQSPRLRKDHRPHATQDRESASAAARISIGVRHAHRLPFRPGPTTTPPRPVTAIPRR